MQKEMGCLLLLAIILTGCAGNTNPASQAPPSSTSLPIQPPSPTWTPSAAGSERQPYPAWVESNIGGVRVELGDDFDTLNSDYAVSQNISASGGQAILPRPGDDETNGTYWIYGEPLSADRAVLLRFRYSSGSDFSIGLRSGEFGTSGFRWVGVNESAMVTGMQEDQSLERYPISEDFDALAPNTWYELMFVIDEGGDFLIQVAPADRPQNVLTTRVHYDDAWADTEWNVSAFVYDGEVLLDRFVSLSYEGYPDVPILSQAQQCPRSQGFPQRLRVEGNQIVDEGGNAVMLRGIATVNPVTAAWEHDAGTPSWERSIDMIADWGANVVRIPVHPRTWRQVGMTAYLQALDQVIALACQHRLYVTLDFHSVGFPPYDVYRSGDDPARTTRQEIRAFWEAASARYANNDAVAFYELFNEPVVVFDRQDEDLVDWLAWKGYVEDVIDLVRDNAPEKTVIVGGLWYAANLEYVPQHPIDRPNVAYSVHPYPGAYPDVTGWDFHVGRVRQSYPVIATEFGFEPSSPEHWSETNHSGARLYRYEIIDYLESHQISWMIWAFSSSWGPSLLEPNFMPSEAGEYFRERLLELNGQ